jgi:Na+/H+ antiporter NhaD/arsenite permease-like protein
MFTAIAVFAFFFLSFVHTLELLLIVAVLAFLALLIYAYRQHATLKQEVSSILTSLRVDASSLTTALYNRIHALENGGHLAAGTAAVVSVHAVPSSGSASTAQPSTT